MRTNTQNRFQRLNTNFQVNIHYIKFLVVIISIVQILKFKILLHQFVNNTYHMYIINVFLLLK